MNYNLSQFEGRYVSRKQDTVATKLTSSSYDIGSHFCTLIKKILSSKIKSIRKDILKMIKSHKKMEPEMALFINHCATLIQSQFRGYQQRKYFKMFRPVLRRFKQLMRAVIAGWRVRRIMKSKIITKKLSKIKQQEGKKNFREARIFKRDLIDDLSSLMAKGKWVQFVDQRKQRKDQTKSKIILRSALRGIEGKSQNFKTRESKAIIKASQKQAKKEVQTPESPRQVVNDLEKQIPIKATGFYQIPEDFKADQGAQKPLTVKKNLKNEPKRLQPKSVSKTAKKQDNSIKGKLQKDVPQEKQIKTMVDPQFKNKITETEKTHNLSAFSIHLPMEQIEANIDENLKDGHKTMKIQVNKLKESEKRESNPLGETQKLKRIGKGIKVTLSSSSVSSASKVEPNSKPIESQKLSEPKSKDQLDQILSVYESAYSAKRNQISARYREMKVHHKFTY